MFKGIVKIPMVKKKLTDDEIKATIFDKLDKRGKWGNANTPTETMVRWIGNRIKKDGKRVNKILDDLIKEGYIISRKSGKVISLNSNKSREIVDFKERILYF